MRPRLLLPRPTRLFSFLLVLLLPCAAYAQNGGVPQESIHPGLEGQELLDALRSDYAPDQTLGYTDARDTLFAYLSEERGELRGVYTG